METISPWFALAVAVLTIYIAWQQYKTSYQTLNLARFDRRMHIYEEVKTFLGKIISNADVTFEEIGQFQRNVTDADFLFGLEISAYLHEIVTHANQLRISNGEYRDYTMIKPEGYNHSETVDRMHEELIWLTNQWNDSREKFRKYLNIGDDHSISFFDPIRNLFQRK
jgi:chlorite dismutase